MKLLFLMFFTFAGLRGEIIDRLAVAVGEEIITEQQILVSLRAAALLNGSPLKTDAAERRSAAQKLVEVTMIRAEMLSNRYPTPNDAAVDELEASVVRQRFAGDAKQLNEALQRYGITRGELRYALRMQLAVITFIDFRFRPGVQIAEDDLTDYYEFEMKAEAGKPKVEYSEARAEILEVLTQQRIDNLLDRWLNETEAQARVRWVEEAFAEQKP